MAGPTEMSGRQAQALAERLNRKSTGGTLAGQVAVLEEDARTAARFILAVLRQIHPSDVYAAAGRRGVSMDDARLTEIVAEYAPYDTLPAFGEGFVAHQSRKYQNPYDGQPAQGVAAQAWDRGLEAAARYARGDDPRNAVPDPRSAAGWLQRIASAGR